MDSHLVVELGEPVVEGHLAGASDHQLAHRHLHAAVTLSAKILCDVVYMCFVCLHEDTSNNLTRKFGSRRDSTVTAHGSITVQLSYESKPSWLLVDK